MKKVMKAAVLLLGTLSVVFTGCQNKGSQEITGTEKVEQAGLTVVLPEGYEQEEADYVAGDITFYMKKGVNEIGISVRKRGENAKDITAESLRGQFIEQGGAKCTDLYEYSYGKGFSAISTFILNEEGISELESAGFYKKEDEQLLKDNLSKKGISVVTMIISDNYMVSTSGYSFGGDLEEFKEIMKFVENHIEVDEAQLLK